ncbi:MAG TPA: RibD family protein [Alphaproteobacteria bacterium]|nr:RibD family protein [Alphaproteobacteria bacterium]
MPVLLPRIPPLDADAAWRVVLALKTHWRNNTHRGEAQVRVAVDGAVAVTVGGKAPAPELVVEPDGGWRSVRPLTPDAGQVFDIYLPLCAPEPGRMTAIAHLGQSLDGRIATHTGNSHYVNGQANILHLHRLRALCDAVLVGAGTVRHDDPRLTVRHCPGRTGLRAVIDTNLGLDAGSNLFRDGAATTVVYCAEDSRHGRTKLGDADIVGLPRAGDWVEVGALYADLEARGVRALLIEGGGVTVSRFLAVRALTHLQVTIAPLIIGSGRPGIGLPLIDTLAEALRPPTRRFMMGEDVMFECRFDGA